MSWLCRCQGVVWEPIPKRAHTQLVRKHIVTIVSARWATVDWSWHKEWNYCTRANLHFKEKKAQAGTEWSNILQKFSQARKKEHHLAHSGPFIILSYLIYPYLTHHATHPFSALNYTPRWGISDAEIKVPSVENPGLKVSPSEGQYKAMQATPTVRNFFPATLDFPGPFTFISFPSFSQFFSYVSCG